MAGNVKFKIGRSAVTGQFTTVQKAQRQPKTHVVETVNRATIGRKVVITAAPCVPPPPPPRKK